MAVTIKVYSKFANALADKKIDFNTDSIKLALCTSSYTPNQDTHDFYDDLTNELTTANGYTAGGASVGTPTITTSGRVTTLDGDDVTWSNSTLTARYAILYMSTGTPGTSPLIAYIDFGEDKSSSSGDFVVQWNASGIVTLTVAA